MFQTDVVVSREKTKARLIEAAGELFAEKGFHGTKIRDIAARAGVNVAAGNYHYGSKKDLYLEVLRAHFARIREQIEARGSGLRSGRIEHFSRGELLRILRTRLRIMLEMIVGARAGLQAQLVLREMVDPSEALPVIVAEFISPLVQEMRQITARLWPELEPQQVERVVFSIAGQVHFYRFMRPVLVPMLGQRAFGPGLLRELEEHIYEFSVAGADRLAARKRRAKP